MTTYKDLLEALSALTEEQLNTEVQFIAEGWPDHDRPALSFEEIAGSFDLVVADEDVVHITYEDSYSQNGVSGGLSIEDWEEDKEPGQTIELLVGRGLPYFGYNKMY